MRAKSLLAFAMAIGCGLVAMVGVQQALQKQKGNADSDKIAVYVAATEILPGQLIDLNMLEKRKFLKSSVPKEAVIDPKQFEKRALIVKMMPGEMLRTDKLGAEGKTGAAISIPVGFRVVSIPTNMTQAHSGMIQPHDRVDVMVTYRVNDAGSRSESVAVKTILGRIEVFAIDATRDTNTGAGDNGAKSAMKNISLLVTEEQAQVLMMAQNVGQIHLALRNSSDIGDAKTTDLTPDQFRSLIASNGLNPNEPAAHQTTPKPQPVDDVNDFLDQTVGGKTVAMAAPVAEVDSNMEQWEIAIYGKEGMKVETVDVPKRKPEITATAAKTETKTVVGSLLNLFNPNDAKQPATPGDDPAPVRDEVKSDKKTAGLKSPASTKVDSKTSGGKSAQTKPTSSIRPTTKSTTSSKPTASTTPAASTNTSDRKQAAR